MIDHKQLGSLVKWIIIEFMLFATIVIMNTLIASAFNTLEFFWVMLLEFT
jgi:hypothetical protein